MSILIKLNINKTTRVECEVYCLPLYGVCLMADFFKSEVLTHLLLRCSGEIRTERDK